MIIRLPPPGIIKTLARVFFIAPLFVLGNRASVFPGFTTQQLQSISLILFKVNNQGTALAMAFFGFSVLLNGYLIFHSTFAALAGRAVADFRSMLADVYLSAIRP